MNREELLEGLKGVRVSKLFTDISLIIFITCVVIFFSLQAFEIGEWFKPIYQFSFVLGFFGFVMLFVQENMKCPNCKKKFNVKINGMYFVRNLFSRKCMNCGLMLNGKNVASYENDL